MSHDVRGKAEEGATVTPPSGRPHRESLSRRSPWRFLPFAFLLAGGLASYALGLHHYVSLSTLVDHRQALGGYVEAFPLRSGLLFFAVYVAVVIFSIPAASVLTMFAGFLFGPLLGEPLRSLPPHWDQAFCSSRHVASSAICCVGVPDGFWSVLPKDFGATLSSTY